MLGAVVRRALPWAVWLVVMGTAGWLWLDLRTGSARGYVEGISYGITAPASGRVAEVTVRPGQRVVAGEVIARLDDAELAAELDVLEVRRRRVEAELQAVEAQTRLRVGDSSRGAEESIDSAELARQQARADRSVRAARLAELDAQIGAVRRLVDQRMTDRRELVELEVERAALRKQIEVDDGIIRRLDGGVAAARERRLGVPADATERAMAPLRVQLEELRAEQEVLARRRDALALRAPGPGEITAVHLRPGEVAVAGAVLATLTSSAATSVDGRPIVLMCASEDEAASIAVGEAVRLTPPGGGSSLPGHVQRLAPAVAELPRRCWRDPRVPQWGRAVYVIADEPVSLLPGQTFAIERTGRPSAHADDAASNAIEPTPSPGEPLSTTMPKTPSARPLAMLVPAALRARTRFEPSAIAWWSARARYLVASDDTGLPDGDERIPWLFTMDAEGSVDPTPLVLEGLAAIDDLESLALAPEGGLYLLASQSRSRKGKRRAARRLFAHVALSDTGARVTASVELVTRLEAAGDEVLAALGLPDTDALDVEGMTPTAAGGLLLGLKGPLTPDDAAIVWHLPRPQQLLATGDPGQAGLVRWGHLPLTVTADGEHVPAGIAELLELPDGSLLVAATAAGADDPATQDGALYHVADPTAAPQRVRTFPGLKPEGLALAPGGDAIVVAFDTGDATPLWMELPWPVR